MSPESFRRGRASLLPRLGFGKKAAVLSQRFPGVLPGTLVVARVSRFDLVESHIARRVSPCCDLLRGLLAKYPQTAALKTVCYTYDRQKVASNFERRKQIRLGMILLSAFRE